MAKETLKQLEARLNRQITLRVFLFNKNIREYAEKVPEAAALQLQRTMILHAIRSLVFKTPVGNPSTWKNPKNKPKGYTGGRARGGWQTVIGQGSDSEIVNKSRTGKVPITKAETVVKNLDKLALVTIFNNVPYILVLEDGHSKLQAPLGMVRVTIDELNTIFG